MTIILRRLVSASPVFALVFLALLHHGAAIICYQCNSEYDPRCGDPFDPYSLGKVNCSYQPRLEHIENTEPTLCRKTTQKIYGKTRVVRSCGFITDHRDDGECMRRSGTHDVHTDFCACTTDLCNGANSNYQSSIFGVFATALATVSWKSYYYYTYGQF